MINQDRLIETFFALVQTDSETTHEQKICEVLKEKFTSLGLEVTEDNAADKAGHGAGNLVCTWKGTNTNADTIYFTSHMDTVVPGNDINPSIQDDVIVSDGTTILGADDKAGIAAMLEAIHTLKEKKIEHGTVQFVIPIGEESGLVGSKELDTSLLSAKYGYALDSEGDVGYIVNVAPSQARLHVVVKGKSAHAGIAPEKGISAITLASRAISKMPLGRIDKDTTANIGSFQGGQKTNIVCDHVEIEAEARSLVPEQLESQVEKMRQAFESAAEELGGTADVEIEHMYPGYRYNDSDQVVEAAKKGLEDIGRKPELIESGGGSDANIFVGHGFPTVNLSIGYKNIHTTEEKIPVQELAKASELVLQIITNTNAE